MTFCLQFLKIKIKINVLSNSLCLRSYRSKYNASTINCLLFFSSALQPKIKLVTTSENYL